MADLLSSLILTGSAWYSHVAVMEHQPLEKSVTIGIKGVGEGQSLKDGMLDHGIPK